MSSSSNFGNMLSMAVASLFLRRVHEALSSVFDAITFIVLLLGFHAAATEFRTAWFLESIATQILVVFLTRTRGLSWRTPTDPRLLISALRALAAAFVLPFTVVGWWFRFRRAQRQRPAALSAITLGYLASAQALKRLAAGD